MLPIEMFLKKFSTFTQDQQDVILADLVVSRNPPSQSNKNIITLALEIALNQSYKTDLKKLEDLLESILEDRQYVFDKTFNDGQVYG